MTDEQKYYRVIAPVVHMRPLTPEQIAGVPHTNDRSNEPAIECEYLFYSNKVPLSAHEIQIQHHLDNKLIAEVTAEEYAKCTSPGQHCFYNPTPEEIVNRAKLFMLD